MFTDPTVQWAIAIVVAVVLFIVGTLTNRHLSKTRKDLSYWRNRWPLIRDEVGSQLQLHFNDEPVEDVSIVMVGLSYRGNEPVRREDYEQKIISDFEASVRVLSAEVVNSNPDNMNPIVISESHKKVRLEPVLFNDRNSMTIKMLVENCNKVPCVKGRIAGVQRLRDAYEDTRMDNIIEYALFNPRRILVASLLLTALFVVALILALILEFPSLAGAAGGITVTLLIIAFTSLVMDRLLS